MHAHIHIHTYNVIVNVCVSKLTFKNMSQIVFIQTMNESTYFSELHY